MNIEPATKTLLKVDYKHNLYSLGMQSKKKSREINENGTFSLYTPPPPLNSEIP